MVIAAFIALCAAADWIWRLGWGYDWYALAYLIVFALIAFVTNRGLSILIGRAR